MSESSRILWTRCRGLWTATKGWLAIGFGVTTGLLAILAVTQAVAVHRSYTEVNWGSVAEAFGAVGGLLAAVGTVGALWVAVLGWQGELNYRRSEEQKRAEAERSAQADLMAAWIQSYTYERSVVVVGLINASRGVFYDVQIDIALETEQALLPGVKDRKGFPVGPYPARAYVPVVQPGEWRVHLRTPGTEFPLVVVGLDVYFRDQREVGWTRNLAGRLEGADRPIFEVPRVSEELARRVEPSRLIRGDYVMVQRPPLMTVWGPGGDGFQTIRGGRRSC